MRTRRKNNWEDQKRREDSTSGCTEIKLRGTAEKKTIVLSSLPFQKTYILKNNQTIIKTGIEIN